VFVALLSQPYALPSTLGTKTSQFSQRRLGPTPSLERAGQKLANPSPTIRACPMSHNLNASTWITSSRY
ncbi:hypothetical protein LINPERHAP2_LOCUS32724, partial [Linum perenne]